MVRNVLTALFAGSLLLIAGLTTILPAVTDTKAVAIRSSSMEPTLPITSLVYVRAQEQYEIGDVITFQANNDLFTHRIVGEWTGQGKGPWMTQGDANEARDADYVPTGAIVGKAHFYLPYLGFVSQVVSQPTVIATLLLFALAVLFWPIIWGNEKAPDSEPQGLSEAR